MWSLGCILAEMLLGKPLFPGSSTINQIEKIVATVPLPQGKDVQELSSDYAQSILDKAAMVNKKPLKEFLPEASSEAFSLVEMLLKFNPSKRLTAHAGLRHPYVARFHNTAQVNIIQCVPFFSYFSTKCVDYSFNIWIIKLNIFAGHCPSFHKSKLSSGA